MGVVSCNGVPCRVHVFMRTWRQLAGSCPDLKVGGRPMLMPTCHSPPWLPVPLPLPAAPRHAAPTISGQQPRARFSWDFS